MDKIYRGSISDIMYQLEKDDYIEPETIDGNSSDPIELSIELVRYHNKIFNEYKSTNRRSNMLKELIILKSKGDIGIVNGIYLDSVNKIDSITEHIEFKANKLNIEFE